MNYVKNFFSNGFLLPVLFFLSSFQMLPKTEALVKHDKQNGVVVIHSSNGRLVFQLKYIDGCFFDRVEVSGKQVVDTKKGISTAVKVDGKWYSSRDKSSLPIVKMDENSVLVEQIRYGNQDFQVEESWKLTAMEDAVEWEIQRRIKGVGMLEDAACAEWVFLNMQMWTGAILDNGGVAWNRLLENKNMTYGSHTRKVLFWNKSDDRCLEIDPVETNNQHIAARFSHNDDDTHSFVQTLSNTILETRVNLSRFLRDSQEVWKPFEINNNAKTVTYRISAPNYKNRFNLGEFKGIDEDAVREILNTITRYGVIDSKLCGANGWRTGYICLHEQWFAQMAMAIQDENYTHNVSETYEYFKEQAIQPDGRVLARFKDDSADAMKGSYTQQGFYEAQWGYLLDSQPDYVMVVAEQFHNTGDLDWVRGQKETCEAALEYLLKRDSDGDGLLEMLNQSHKDERGSDWIDIIWAAHENALVNAEMYGAMILWAEVEEILGDKEKSAYYIKAAQKLKNSFNKDIKDGGFWNPGKNWYVYWREEDNSIYGDNLVIPVNFSAIGYGLCDDKVRKEKLLTGLETAMQKEDLFSWPLCIHSFEPKEGKNTNFPFPGYENGDIFLSWVELGTRAYAGFDARIAMKYIGNIIEQYKKDGLAHQRYARISQRGLGDDILAGNGMAVIGLYRNIFGIQPQYNRLYLEPHLTTELNNTTVKYNLRGTNYNILLKTDQYFTSANHFTISSSEAFGININIDQLEYYEGKSSSPKLIFETDGKAELHIDILEKNNEGLQNWTLQSKKTQCLKQTVFGLNAGMKYKLIEGSEIKEVTEANDNGTLSFSINLEEGQKKTITLLPLSVDNIHD
jgi:hypothetical protein